MKALNPLTRPLLAKNFKLSAKMRRLQPHERKVILIEEAWKAISKSGTAEFIKYLYKTVRKHNGEVIVVTQEVGERIQCPEVSKLPRDVTTIQPHL